MDDLIDIAISRFGTSYEGNGPDSTGNLHYNCVFCEKRRGKADSDHKLYVKVQPKGHNGYKNLGKWHCFKCGAKGKLVKQLSSNTQVYKKLLNIDFTNNEDEDDENMFYVKNIKIPKMSVAENYLLERGISRELIDYYDMRLGIDELFGRIVIPNIVYGREGIWTDMYSARSYMKDISPKYRNPVNSFKNSCVFNLDRMNKGGECYVTEGVITAICAGKQAVATYGCSPSEEQVIMIVEKEFDELYCVYDNDEAGQKGNRKLSDMLSKYIKVKNLRTKLFTVLMPEGIDAADMGESNFKKYVRENRIPYHSGVYSKLLSMKRS